MNYYHWLALGRSLQDAGNPTEEFLNVANAAMSLAVDLTPFIEFLSLLGLSTDEQMDMMDELMAGFLEDLGYEYEAEEAASKLRDMF